MWWEKKCCLQGSICHNIFFLWIPRPRFKKKIDYIQMKNICNVLVLHEPLLGLALEKTVFRLGGMSLQGHKIRNSCLNKVTLYHQAARSYIPVLLSSSIMFSWCVLFLIMLIVTLISWICCLGTGAHLHKGVRSRVWGGWSQLCTYICQRTRFTSKCIVVDLKIFFLSFFSFVVNETCLFEPFRPVCYWIPS